MSQVGDGSVCRVWWGHRGCTWAVLPAMGGYVMVAQERLPATDDQMCERLSLISWVDKNNI